MMRKFVASPILVSRGNSDETVVKGRQRPSTCDSHAFPLMEQKDFFFMSKIQGRQFSVYGEFSQFTVVVLHLIHEEPSQSACHERVPLRPPHRALPSSCSDVCGGNTVDPNGRRKHRKYPIGIQSPFSWRNTWLYRVVWPPGLTWGPIHPVE